MNPTDKLIEIPDKMYTRKAFIFGTKSFTIGEPFPTDQFDARRIRQLWSQRKIGTAADLKHDQDRYAARCDAEKAAKRSLEKADSALGETISDVMESDRPVTAEDFDL